MTLFADRPDTGTGLITSRGRPVIFTPERMDQIRNLVERGHTREQIAELIGCTVGSLTVTCSRANISLRRPRAEGAPPVKRTPIVPAPPRPATSVLEPPGGWPPGHPFRADDPPKVDSPKAKPITFSLRIDYGNRKYDVPLKIDSHTLCELACMADMNGVSLTDMIARAIVAGAREITS